MSLAELDDLRMFVCAMHRFVAVAVPMGEVSCRGTPGHRRVGCSTCDRVIADAFAYAAFPGREDEDQGILFYGEP